MRPFSFSPNRFRYRENIGIKVTYVLDKEMFQKCMEAGPALSIHNADLHGATNDLYRLNGV